LPTFFTNYKHFRAPYPPIDTWSYCPADVGTESTEAGFDNNLFSDVIAADVSKYLNNLHCKIIMPLLIPDNSG
jgi:hypothetical protein